MVAVAKRTMKERIAKERRAYDRARQRLELPAYASASVSQVAEAWDCVGCRAEYARGIRIVHVIRGCPAHAVRPGAARPRRDRARREA